MSESETPDAKSGVASSISPRVQAFLERYARREREPLTRAQILALFEKFHIQPCDAWVGFEQRWGGFAFQSWHLELDYEETLLDDGKRLMGFAEYLSAPCFLLMDDQGKLYAVCKLDDYSLIAESFQVLLEQEALLAAVLQQAEWYTGAAADIALENFPGIQPVPEASDSKTQWWSNAKKTLWLQKTSLWGGSKQHITAYAPNLETLRPFLLHLSQQKIEAHIRPVSLLYS